MLLVVGGALDLKREEGSKLSGRIVGNWRNEQYGFFFPLSFLLTLGSGVRGANNAPVMVRVMEGGDCIKLSGTHQERFYRIIILVGIS